MSAQPTREPADRFMREAIALARRGARRGDGGPFGAVVVRDGQVVGRGWNRVLAARDPSAHAEVVAIRAACRRLGTHVLAGCEIYASCEPCPMCLAAIHWARLDRVWFAADRRDAAAAGLDDARLYRAFAAAARGSPRRGRLLEAEARAVMAEWRAWPDRILY